MTDQQIPAEGDAAEAAEPAASAEQSTESTEAPRASRRKFKTLWVGGAVVAALVLGGALWWIWPVQNVQSVNLFGVEYTTNMEIDVYDGHVYVTVPVNTKPQNVVLKVDNQADNTQIREFLDSLDTLVPGEHALALSETNLRFIVDGMADE